MCFCVVSHSNVTPLNFPHYPRAFAKKYIYSKIRVCASYSPAWQRRADNWHHTSLCLCRSRLQRARRGSHPISPSRPVREIITDTDNFLESYFYVFYFLLVCKSGRSLNNTDTGFRTRTQVFLFPAGCHVRTLQQRLFLWVVQGLSLCSLIHHCHSFQPSRKTWKLALQNFE